MLAAAMSSDFGVAVDRIRIMRCASCEAENDRPGKFCVECGAPMSVPCPACGTESTRGRFCAECGAALDTTLVPTLPADPRLPAAPAPLAERRVCSVLFCDLVGFTPLSEGRDPEDVRELLSRYFDVARTVIGRYGGVVEKFIGDAVMAVWGTPVAVEGDAERAVRAALDVVAAVAQLGVEAGVAGLAARAGVVTGEVAVTLGATNEGMVAGDAVNTAARVQSAAAAGTVFVDGVTRRLASSAIGFDDSGEHALKGKAEPERLWRATRVLSGVGGSQRVDGLEAPLVGRDAELRTIKELFHAAAERRLPRLVVVSGPAGVGKSRLGWEFEKYIDGLVGRVLWHRGRCLSYGDGVAFWALAEIVRQRFGIAEEDPVEVAAARLANGLLSFVPDTADQAYIGPRLARLLGVPFDDGPGGVLAQEELFAGWRLFFEQLAVIDPVVLLVEDAHYADSGLLDFLDHLVDWARDLPIFVLVFARPELEQNRPGFGAGHNRTALTADPLDAASMSILVDALVPGMPGAARTAIVDRAQGIPLFAVETVRSLIDRDVVQPIEGEYRLVGDVGELAVPDSLHGLLAARLDALDPDVRALVADAAVLGSTFPAEALVAVSGGEETSVRAALADLLRREVLEISADPLSPERGTYRFSQDMLRQVAYETLSRRDRKARHLTVAAHLRATFPDDGEEVMDVVARHYLDALAAVPDDPDIDTIADDAVSALTRGAGRAERTGAPARAAAAYAAAADLIAGSMLPDAESTAAGLWQHAADAAIKSSEWATALEHAARAQRAHADHGDVRAAARAQATAGEALRQLGRHRDARNELTAALNVLRAVPDTDTVYALNELAAVETQVGTPDADRLTTDALTLGQALEVDSALLTRMFVVRGICLDVMGRRVEAAAYYRESARLAEQADDTTQWGLALFNLSDSLAFDDPAAAAVVARDAVAHLRHTGNRAGLGWATGNLAYALIAAGDWDGAADALQAAAEADGLHDVDYIKANRAWLAGLRGDVETSERLLIDLHELRDSEDPQDRSMVARARACIAAASDQPAAALRQARIPLDYADQLGIGSECPRWAWPVAARAAHDLNDTDTTDRLLAQLDAYQPGQLAPMQRAERDLVSARLAGRRDDADTARMFVQAVASLRTMSTPYHLAHGLIDHAEYLQTTGDAAAAGPAIDEAREIATRLGCQLLLDRAANSANLAAFSSQG
jgi:class 3 adenylate cyclase/tetratricopeptide (TPR) repeat protein